MIERLDQLQSFLESSISEDSAWTYKVISELASDNRATINFLKLLTSSADTVQSIATASYKHINNFDKIVLASFGAQKCKLRLHVWWQREAAELIENIHNHRWDFSTALLYGNYRFQVFEEGGIEPYYEYSYQSPGNDEFYIMTLVAKTSAQCVLETELNAGARYKMSHRVLHRVIANSGGTVVSLMCQGATLLSGTRVLTEKQVPDAEHVPVERMKPDEVVQKLNGVIALLETRQ